MKIICLSGKAGAGKDTAALCMKNLLEDKHRCVLITHYADLLKYICKSFFGWDGKKDENGRSLLQKVGTGAVRSRNPDYWVDFLIGIFDMFGERWDYVLIPDCRFPNEVSRLIDCSFDVVTVNVIRAGTFSVLTGKQKNHISENAMDTFAFDYTINNYGTIEDLKNEIEKFICELD